MHAYLTGSGAPQLTAAAPETAPTAALPAPPSNLPDLPALAGSLRVTRSTAEPPWEPQMSRKTSMVAPRALRRSARSS